MKEVISLLNKAFDHRIRLGIMSILVSRNDADFKELKMLLDLTDGNLASHLRVLENADYIKFKKKFKGRKPITIYQVTRIGRSEFKNHIDLLSKLIRAL